MSYITSHHKKRYGAWAGMPNGVPPNPDNCAAEVYRDHHHWQCTRKRGHGPEGAYCKQHDPQTVAKKRAEWEAKWEADWIARRAKRRCENFAPRFEEALRQIASGHNDPRSLATELLAEYDKS